MAEIYTISGSTYDAGLPAATRPVSSAVAPTLAAGAPPAVILQNALKALGTTSGDPALTSLKVDGIIGPATTKAVNHALANYVGGTPAFPRADLTAARVRQYAGALATLIVQRVQKSGGMVPAPKVEKALMRRAPTSVASFAPVPYEAASASGFTFDKKWMWYAIGGGGALLLLMVVGTAVQRRRAAAA